MSESESSCQRIDGLATSKALYAEYKERVAELKEKHGQAPALAVILVGERKDSQTYVRMKTKACNEVGVEPVEHTLPEDVSEAKLMEVVAELNADPKVNGILVQLPLPKHIDADKVVQSISPLKDVDGLTEANAGNLFRLGMKGRFIPCTALGCMLLLKRYNVPLEGKHAVVIGRSMLVGKPVSLLLQSENATVTMCHSRTKDLPSVVQQADIVIAAIGKANFVQGDWLKPGAVVIDVGINAVDDSTKKAGFRLVGDVEYASAVKVASAATPVPGGVGPMTVACLIGNTINAFELAHKN